MDKPEYNLNQIKNDIQIWQNPGPKRKKKTILNRLRINSSHIITSWQKNNPPRCETCGVEYTVKHIITEYKKYEDMKKKTPCNIPTDRRSIWTRPTINHQHHTVYKINTII